MAIRHLGRAIFEEASAMTDEMEREQITASVGRPSSGEAEARPEAGPRLSEASTDVSIVDLNKVYDSLSMTRGLFEAANTVVEHHVPLEQRTAIDTVLFTIEERVSEAKDQLTALVERLKTDQRAGA